MRIELAGRQAIVCGEPHPVRDAIVTALEANGCAVAVSVFAATDPVPEIVVVASDAKLDGNPAPPVSREAFARIGEAMARRGGGRIIVVTSATAAVPARRFPEASVAAGAAALGIRTMAMQFGPSVLVNGVGCGAIADPEGGLVAGDALMLSHVPTGEPGGLADVVHAVLFLCDPRNSYMTGQLLTVDGGWSTGYGRNF